MIRQYLIPLFLSLCLGVHSLMIPRRSSARNDQDLVAKDIDWVYELSTEVVTKVLTLTIHPTSSLRQSIDASVALVTTTANAVGALASDNMKPVPKVGVTDTAVIIPGNGRKAAAVTRTATVTAIVTVTAGTPAIPPQTIQSQPVQSQTVQSQPVQSQPVQSQAVQSAAAAAPVASGLISTGSGGCPADTSRRSMSPGIKGYPEKSTIDSMNMIRRWYNATAPCLTWNEDMYGACVNDAAYRQESFKPLYGPVTSDAGYGSMYGFQDLVTTLFERSIVVMLCQSPDDPQLHGTCTMKILEAVWTSDTTTRACDPSKENCTGHHDVIVDAGGKFTRFAVAWNTTSSWLAVQLAGPA